MYQLFILYFQIHKILFLLFSKIILMLVYLTIDLIKNHLTESTNIFTGMATLILGFFTYKSVQTSNNSLRILQNQNNILQKSNELKSAEQEKELILEQICNYYHPLKKDINSEIDQIKLKLFYFFQYSSTKQLVFPIPPSKHFYDGNTNSRNTLTYQISTIKPEILFLSSNRYELYQKIQEEFIKINAIFKQNEFECYLYSLINEYEIPSIGYYTDNLESEYMSITFRYFAKYLEDENGQSYLFNDYQEGTVSLDSFFEDLQELLILDLFSPIDLNNPEKYECNPSYYNFSKYKRNIPKNIIQQFKYNRGIIYKYLEELFETDNKILYEITTHVDYLVQKYSIPIKEMTVQN